MRNFKKNFKYYKIRIDNKKMTSKRKLFNKNEVIIVLIILLLAILVYVFFRLDFGKNQEEITANIYVFSELYKTVTLDGGVEYEKILIDAKLEVEIIIEGKEIYFHKSQCPDKVCINAGRLKYPHQSAACLPAEVSILLT